MIQRTIRMPFFDACPSRSLGWVALCLTATVAIAAGAANAQVSDSDSTSDATVGSVAPVRPASTAPASTAVAVPKASRPAVSSKPEWKDLPPVQKRALEPLAAIWNPLSETQKRKWLAISANFEKLPATEQNKLQERMREWVLLSPAQRNQARLNFAEAKQLSPTEKQAKWQAYQALSAEEKERLAGQAVKPRIGAATTIKPVPKQKLIIPPVDPVKAAATKASAPHELPVEPLRKVDRNTLLPQPR